MNKSLWRWLWVGLLVVVLLGLFPLTLSAQPAKTSAQPTGVPVTGLIQWQKDGVPLATAYGNQRRPQIVTDGAGGALVVWEDYRYGLSAPADLYAQRVSAAGQTLWQQDGVPVAVLGNQADPRLISDGQGGAIVVWRDDRTGKSHIYVQRIAGDGTLLWPTDGLQLSSDIGDQTNPMIASDQAGGAIVTWADYGERQGVWPIVYVQRIRADGTLAWAIGGITVTGAWHGQFFPQIASDGAGGAILAWSGDCDRWPGLCVQRVLSDGTLAWGSGGVVVSVSGEPQDHQSQILADGLGGATVVWVDVRYLNDDLYAQRITADGTAVWAGGGVPVIVADGDQQQPLLVSDGHGGSIISWFDMRVAENGIYLQRIDAAGQARWGSTGVPIQQVISGLPDKSIATHPHTTSAAFEYYYDLASDGADGALVTWWGGRNTSDGWADGVWLQRVTSGGAKAWTGWGALVQSDPFHYGTNATRLLNDRIGGAIVVWEDNRHGYKNDNFDIYAQRVIEGSYRYYFPSITR